ncbi:hypothetical protein SAMN05421748_1287 [Paractinoplanes atraurantiacus]|uniref:Uncharacterized protein n=2 Tax=Paractinoplanes atraurantiacus TaxID=1036182 RepID=A0A285JYT7_9ACTN|nr:hypothetical protein SAMN05421748_1287 [Actinoplanes atraurantiacus]
MERIRDLLDEAVGELEPSDPDPVAGVMRRGRAVRARRAAVAGVVAAVLVGGGVAGGWRMAAEEPRPAAGDGWVAPHVVDGVVVAGALELPVPDGWRVVVADEAAPCEKLERTILLVMPGQGGCQKAPVEMRRAVSGGIGGVLFGPVAPEELGGGPFTSLASLTLRGGEPAWLVNGVGSQEPDLRPYEGDDYLSLLLPWSETIIGLRMDGAAKKEIVDSMRSDPSRAGVLALPENASSVSLTLPDDTGRIRAAGRIGSDDPTTAAAVLRLLRGQTDVVGDADACAGPEQLNARLVLRGAGSYTVIISLGERCQEAVSSAGGRVRLSDATVAELKRLFGIATVVAK